MKRIFNLIFIVALIMISIDLKAETISYTEKDSLLYSNCIDQLKADSNLPINELMLKTALFFKDTPYVASTLDKNENEQLVINFRELDCTTFVETCIALTLTLKSNDYSFLNYCNQLRKIRYRDNKIEDYTSRLHYVSDWIFDNSTILKNETKSFGGIRERKKIDFMSTHITSYPSLNDLKLQNKIRHIENNLNERGGYYILEKSRIASRNNDINDGDIIAFATSIPGLDYSHMGIAFHNQGELTFIHASTRTMKVTIEILSLSDYCYKSTKCTGISVFRLND